MLFRSAVTAYDISQKVLESAEEAERVAFAMYQVGKGDILTLLTASSNLASARKEVIVAFYAVLKSKSSVILLMPCKRYPSHSCL